MLLATFGLHPRHRFGQNFLHNADKMGQIIAAAELSPGDLVLEVGPGTGALSVRLLAAGARLVAVEIDRDLQPILESQLGLSRTVLQAVASASTGENGPASASSGEHGLQSRPTADLIIDDVLDGKHAINPRVYESLQHMTGCGSPSFKLVANLPYNVASPLIANLLLAPFPTADTGSLAPGSPSPPRLSLAVVLIQREVADRLLAPPGGKDYGPLGILVQMMCEVDRIATLPPGCFWPSPKVDSAVVRLRVREKPLVGDPRRLTDLLHRLFSKRRKQLGAILGRRIILPDGIDANQRPEQLTLVQLAAMTDAGI